MKSPCLICDSCQIKLTKGMGDQELWCKIVNKLIHVGTTSRSLGIPTKPKWCPEEELNENNKSKLK